MRARLAAAVGIALLLASAGCVTTEHLRFAALSSHPVPTLGYPKENSIVVPDVAVLVRSHTIFWIPTNTRTPTLQDAVDAALRKGGGNLLVNAEVEHWWLLLPFLYGQEGWSVRGDVVHGTPPPLDVPAPLPAD
jgi:hypothetical protein